MKNIAVSIDLGSDTCKVAFAYSEGRNVRFGKLVDISMPIAKPFPSIAAYDADEKVWHYASDAIRSGCYDYIVNIKDLLYLLTMDETGKELFEKSHEFPLFSLSIDGEKKDFMESIKSEDTSFKGNLTPKEVCVGYFRFLAQKVGNSIFELAKIVGEPLDYDLTLVYPTIYGKLYGETFSKIVSDAFGKPINFNVDSARSSCFLAYHLELIKENEKILIFDIGKEQTSVVKAGLAKDNKGNKYVSVDGMDGHSGPIDLGGKDVDNAILEDLYARFANQESIGRSDNLVEEMTMAQQFLLANSVKNFKIEISRHDEFYEGEIGIPGEVIYNEPYSTEELMVSLGMKEKESTFSKNLLKYINNEINKDINSNVKKVFLTGGTIETFRLFEYLKKGIERKNKGLKDKIYYFEINSQDKELKKFRIKEMDDSTYANALGAAIAKIKGYTMKTVLSYSYGTYMDIEGHRLLYFYDGAIRGKALKKGENRFDAGSRFHIHPSSKQYIYSINLSDEEVNSKFKDGQVAYYKTKAGVMHLDIGKSYFEKAEKVFDLRVVSGSEKGKKGHYKAYRKTQYGRKLLEKTTINSEKEYIVDLVCKEYILIDDLGRVKPMVECVEVKKWDKAPITVDMTIVNQLISNPKNIIIEYEAVDEFTVE